MAYLGNAPARSFISFERQVFTIVNSQTAYTLSHSVNNENDIRLVVNNIVQEPGSGKAYTASGTTLTLSAALTNGTDEMYCVFLGRATATNAPGAGSVGTSQLASDAVTEAKIADAAVESEHLNNNVISGQTELAAEPADTDEFLVSDAGTLKRIDYSHIKASPAMELLSSTDASSSSSLSLDLFSSTYKNYKILISNLVCSNNDWLFIRFRRSSSDVSSANYYNANFQAYKTSSAQGDFNNSNWQDTAIRIFVTSGDSSKPGSSELTIFDPFGTNYTQMTSLSTYWENTSSYRTSFQGATLQDATTSVTGITIFPTSGNITGSIKLYGIK